MHTLQRRLLVTSIRLFVRLLQPLKNSFRLRKRSVDTGNVIRRNVTLLGVPELRHNSACGGNISGGHKCDQDVKSLWSEQDSFATTKQRMPIGVQMVRAKFVLTAGRHKAEFFEEFNRKIAASLKDFQRRAQLSS
jgi:hypothetical protein